jgi:amino acid adenylation domain-containing protein
MNEMTSLLHVRFGVAAREQPQRAAIVASGTSFTYRDLDRLSDSLAARLIHAGAGPEKIVGIHLPRSAEAVIAMLGALKAGAAYLALPTDYPVERLRFMLDDARVRWIVTEPALEAGLPDHAAERVFFGESRDTAPAVMRARAVRPENLAYIIYTSGSTGEPKGVGVTHAGAVNLVDPAQAYVHFGSGETFLQLAPLAFDASAFEIWGALASGGTLVISAPSYRAIDELPDVLSRSRVTTLLLTPVLFHALMERRPQALDGVERLIVGGDVMSARHARAFVERARRRQSTACLSNVYGPTEATTLVSHHPVHDVSPDAARIPLGCPIRGATLYLLDETLSPIGAGEEGEIYIGGIAVTRGYLGRPGLTSLCFVPDPFSDRPGARMYATGDLGVLDDAGLLTYTGRRDHQVKVRGHRVELGEIERALERHPAVREACVVLFRRGSTEKLIAHITMAETPGEGLPRLDEHLAGLLPGYMLPGQIVRHDALPMTSTGKVDRNALSALEPGPQASDGDDDLRSAREALMARIWQQILEIDHVGLDDDFFSLGGDSLLAIQVVARAEECGLPLTLVLLFKNPTVRGVCAGLSGARAGAGDSGDPVSHELVAPEDRARLRPEVEMALPATRLQLGMVYESLLSEGACYVDAISRTVLLPLEPASLRRAIDRLSARHPILRTRFDLASFQEPLQLVHRAVALPLEIDDHRELCAGELPKKQDEVMRALARPFDPEALPLMRFHAAATGNDRFRLSYAFHHAILDGWSESVLATELIESYAALLRNGQELELPSAAPFSEFVRLEREALRESASRHYFARFAEPVERIASRPRRIGPDRYHKLSRRVPDATVKCLDSRSTEWGLPVKSLLVAAYYAAVAAAFGKHDLVVGLSMSGRPEIAGADRTLGLFLNHLPLRLELEGATWASLARQAFDAENELLPHRRFPYAEMRKISGGDLFDVALSYVHFRFRNRLLDQALIDSEEDCRDHTSLPVRVEAINDAQGEGFSLDVSIDLSRHSARLAHDIATWLLTAMQRLCTDPSERVLEWRRVHAATHAGDSR